MKFIRDLISEKRSAKHSEVSIPPTVWDEETSVVPEPVEILPTEAPDVLALTPQDEVAEDFAALDEGFDSEEALIEEAALEEEEIDAEFEQDLDAAFAEDEDGYELPSPEFDALEEEELTDEAEFEAFAEESFEEALDETAEMVEVEMPEEETVEPFERRKLWTSLRDETYATEAEEPFIAAPEPVDETARAIAALDLSRPAPAPVAPAPVAQADDSLDLSGLPFIHVGGAAPAAAAGLEVPTPSLGRGSGRSGRVKTRLLGFNPDGLAPASPFEKAAPADTNFPVGWLVVVSGPGRGASFPLFDGVAKIGRGEDQAVSLNFGDSAISRENHAAVAYDSEENAFYIGQSGKANLVRLNNKPLLSTEQIRSGDQVRLGETTLRFVALCGEGFSWDAASQKDVKHAG